MILPGRFPSPTPEPELSPTLSPTPSQKTEPCLSSLPALENNGFRLSVSRKRSQSRHVSADFTALDHHRQRPQFSETQSEPVLPSTLLSSDQLLNTASVASNSKEPANKHRRVSEPQLRDSPEVQLDSSEDVPESRKKRRRVSSSQRPDSRSCTSTQSCTGLNRNDAVRRYFAVPQVAPEFPHTPDNRGRSSGLLEQFRSYLHSEQGQEANRDQNVNDSPASSTSPRSVHSKLLGKLRENVSDRGSTVGCIYILRSEDYGYKIGSTARCNPEKRFSEHLAKCEIELERVHESSQIENCLRVEKLIQADLEEYCVPWACENEEGRVHKEYFQVDLELAIETVRKWEAFMIHERPYNWRRRLKPIWRYLLKTRCRSLGINGTLTHDMRRRYWDVILASPTPVDYFRLYKDTVSAFAKALANQSIHTYEYVQAFWWQLTTVAYGIATVTVCQNTISVLFFTIFVLSAGRSVANSSDLLSRKKKARKSPRWNVYESPRTRYGGLSEAISGRKREPAQYIYSFHPI